MRVSKPCPPAVNSWLCTRHPPTENEKSLNMCDTCLRIMQLAISVVFLSNYINIETLLLRFMHVLYSYILQKLFYPIVEGTTQVCFVHPVTKKEFTPKDFSPVSVWILNSIISMHLNGVHAHTGILKLMYALIFSSAKLPARLQLHVCTDSTWILCSTVQGT